MRIIVGKGYQIPECKIVVLSEEDVITTSGVFGDDNVLTDPWEGFSD